MHRFDPERRHLLISEERYRSLPPAKVLDQLPLRPGMTVADIGCGPGYFTLPLAERLPQGHVHAVDIEPLMLDAVRERAAEAGRANITTHLATPSAVPLPAGSLDGALMALTFLFIPAADRASYLARLRALMRPGGWLAILEWDRRQSPGAGPPLEARVAPEDTYLALSTTGWHPVALVAPNEWMYLVLAGYAPGTDGHAS